MRRNSAGLKRIQRPSPALSRLNTRPSQELEQAAYFHWPDLKPLMPLAARTPPC